MTLNLDATYSLGENLSGVGVYSRRILDGLAAAHPEHSFRFCYRPHRFAAALREPRSPNVRIRPLIDALGCSGELFHGLNQRLPRRLRQPAVTTFHDLFVMTADYSTPEFRVRFSAQARDAAARSARIIAVSDFTARQVVDLLEVDRERISVVHHGVDLPEEVPGIEARERIILSVGAIQTRKNTARLVRAFRAVPAGWRLILAGSTGYGAEAAIAEVERSPRHADIAVMGYLAGHDLRNLYRRAAIFAFPSLDEGFGMPVLEAMAHGIPVITSKRSAMEEVAGEAALLVNPREELEIAAAFESLIANEDKRASLVAAGRQRARHFPWSSAVDKTWTVYGKLFRR